MSQLEFIPKEQFDQLSISVTLPCCGLLIRQCLSKVRSENTEELLGFVTNEAPKLNWWLQDRVGKHRCKLVTEENPLGRIDKAPISDE